MVFSINDVQAQEHKEIKGIKRNYHIELVNRITGEIMPFDQSCNIFYYNDWILYQIPIKEMVTKEDANGLTQMELTDSINHYRYLVFQKSSRNGIMYDQDLSPNGESVLVDSILKEIGSVSEDFFENPNDKLVETIESPDKSAIIEKYVPQTKPSDKYSDSTHFYFVKNFIDVDFTFSRKLEMSKGLKLIKVIKVYNAIPQNDKYKIAIPKRYLQFEIEPLIITNADYILEYFNKAKSFKE